MLRPTWLLSVLALTSFASAQIVAPPVVSLTGVVEPVEFDAAQIICAPPTHTLECSGGTIFLQSNTLDLDDYVGMNVKLTGQGVDKGCPLLEISAVEPPDATLTLCGTPGLGCIVRLRSGPGGLSQHALLVSLAPGFLPANPSKGSLLLASPSFVLANSGAAHHPVEGVAFDFEVPVDFNLVGIPLYFQAMRRDVGPIGPFRFSNAVCLTLLGVPVTCITPDC